MTKIDKGRPPASVAKKQSLINAVMNDEDIPKIKSSTHENEEFIPESNSVPLKKVTLEHDLYTLSFGVVDVSVSEHQLAIKLPKTDHFLFEPKVNSPFLVKHLGRVYPVVYLGGVFNFSSDNTWAITFLIDKQIMEKEIQEDD
jgi:hypothetical protein